MVPPADSHAVAGREGAHIVQPIMCSAALLMVRTVARRTVDDDRLVSRNAVQVLRQRANQDVRRTGDVTWSNSLASRTSSGCAGVQRFLHLLDGAQGVVTFGNVDQEPGDRPAFRDRLPWGHGPAVTGSVSAGSLAPLQPFQPGRERLDVVVAQHAKATQVPCRRRPSAADEDRLIGGILSRLAVSVRSGMLIAPGMCPRRIRSPPHVDEQRLRVLDGILKASILPTAR